MRALTVVAHPDDCVIFAYSFIHAHSGLDWTILYLTYTQWDHRGKELFDFWNKRNINCIFLGYHDDWHDIENKKISFDTDQAQREIQGIIKDFDLVLTHNSAGEYGHLHHQFVHTACQTHPALVTFADRNTGTDTYFIPPGTYHIDELPEHGPIIQGFHNVDHVNNYTVPDHVKLMLKNHLS